MGKSAVSLESIRSEMGRTPDRRKNIYLDLGEVLNRIIGRPGKGLRYGIIVEILGPFSAGKTAMCIDIAAEHQSVAPTNDVIWVDLENSFEQPKEEDSGLWPQKRGLICHVGSNRFHLIQPYFVKMKVKKGNGFRIKKVLASTEMLLDEAEQLLKALHEENPERRFIMVLDSIAAIQAEAAVKAEAAQGTGMKESISAATMLSRTIPKWVSLLPITNCILLAVNQFRTKPGMMFGDPNYGTGGNAIPYYAQSRFSMKRYGRKSRILMQGRQIGIMGLLKSIKNKLGGFEDEVATYKIYRKGHAKYIDGVPEGWGRTEE